MRKLTLLLFSWLILLSLNVCLADDECYMYCQSQYDHCVESCDPDDFDCVDICYTDCSAICYVMHDD